MRDPPRLPFSVFTNLGTAPDARAQFAVDQAFDDRRELWRLHAHLAVVATEEGTVFGRRFLARLECTVRRYD